MAAAIAGPIGSDLDPYSDGFLADPYPGYRELRDLGPVVHLRAHDAFALPRYAEVREALGDWGRFSSASGVALNEPMNSSETILHMDPPQHDRAREFLMVPLTARGLREVSDQIEAEARRLAEDLAERQSFDGVRDLAQRLPLAIVSRLVGLPEDGRNRMLDWAADSFNALGPMNDRTARSLAGLAEVQGYLANEVGPENVVPGSWAADVFDRAARASIPMELAGTLLLAYVLPSLDTTIQGLANAVWLFGRNPDQWTLLRDRPELLNRAINETLRLESPVQIFSRQVVGGDHEFAGTTLPEGARALMMFASANRDERKWREPERFDITRDGASEHLAFGFGQHLCIGQGLARLELRAVLRALLDRGVESFEIGDCERPLNNTLRGFSRMDVTVKLT